MASVCPGALDKARERLHGGYRIGVGGGHVLAAGHDAFDDCFARCFAADILGAGVLENPEIDAAHIAHRKIDRAGLDLRRRSDRLGGAGRKYLPWHVVERNPR